MKIRLFTIGILLSLVGLVAVSCEQDLSIKRDYDFEIKSEKYHEELSVGETLTLNLSLVQEGEYEATDYFVSYFLRKGEGTVSDEDWNVLNENTLYKITPKAFIVRKRLRLGVLSAPRHASMSCLQGLEDIRK